MVRLAGVLQTVTVTADAPDQKELAKKAREAAANAAKALKDTLDKITEQQQALQDDLDSAAGTKALRQRSIARKLTPLANISEDGMVSSTDFIKAARGFDDASVAKRAADLKAQVASEQAAAKQAEQLAQAFINGVQNVFATGLNAIFTKGLSGIKDFGAAIRDTILHAFEQVLASQLTAKFLSLFGGGGGLTVGGGVASGGSVASGGGVLGSVAGLAGLGGLFKVNTSGISTGAQTYTSDGQLIGTAGGAARGMSSQVMGGAGIAVAGGALGYGIGKEVGGGLGIAGSTLAGAATGAIAGGWVGAIVGGIAGLIGGIFGNNAKSSANAQRADALAKQAQAFTDELTQRTLIAAGKQMEATKLDLIKKQESERQTIASQYGTKSPLYAYLLSTQMAERNALDMQQGEQNLSPGNYLAPAGYSVNNNRFAAGNPYTTQAQQPDTVPTKTFTGDIYIQVPQGTTQDQARAMLAAFDALNRAQGNTYGSMPRPN
jgi:hypothetical protein